MIITKHLLEQFISLQGIDKEEILSGLNQIGLEVESFQELKAPKHVVVGKVLQKSKHPSADKLSVCQVDVGKEVLQIVCGAQNVEMDQWVAVALEGCILQTPKGRLEIKPTNLRGVESFGMICSSVELGFPKLNEGIMVLDSSIGELQAGEMLCAYPLFDNFLIELGLTPNRGDCLSILGVARDLSVILGIPLQIKNYQDENTVFGIGRVLQVIHEGDFSSSVLYKVAHLSSVVIPFEMSLSLAMCGISPQNSLQDFLNYAMHNIGVILRIYPLERFKRSDTHTHQDVKAEVLLKKEGQYDCVYSSKCESIVGISQNEISMSEGMLLLEASYIDPLIVSEWIYQNKALAKDSQISYKTTRGSNPDLLLGMQYLCELLIRFLKIEIYSSHHRSALEEKNIYIKTTFDSIDSILGQKIDKEEITNLLKKIGFRIEASRDETFFMAIPPFYRHDIKTIQDVAEEILRFYGIEKIKNTSLQFIEQSPRKNDLFFRYKRKRNLIKRAVSQGFSETLHYLFYDRSKMQELHLECVQDHLDVLNPITHDLNTFRSSLLPAMLDSIERNKNLGFKAIGFCEIGICCNQDRKEIEKIAFVVDPLKKIESLSHPKGVKWDFYTFASSIAEIIGEFELKETHQDAPSKLFHPFVSAWIYKEGEKIGCIGKINPQSGYAEGLICELLLEPLLQERQREQKEICRFQSNVRDLTILIQKDIPFWRIKKALQEAKINYLASFYPLDLYQSEEFGDQVALSLRFVLRSLEKTLQEDELAFSMQEALSLLEREFNATLRQ